MTAARIRALSAIATVAMTMASARNASAGGRDVATAQALFEAARQDVLRGSYAAACPKFIESQRLDPAPGTMINLADCEEHLGHLAAAWDAWHEGIALLPRGDERLAPTQQRAQALDKRLPRLVIRLSTDAPPDTKLHRDDVDLGAASLGVPLPVDPGSHTVRAESSGHVPSTAEVTLAEGETRAMEVSPGPLLPPAPAPAAGPALDRAPLPVPPAGERSRPAGLRTAGWIVGAAGAVGLGVGAVTGLFALSEKETVDHHCDATKGCDQSGYDAARTGHTLATASDIAFVGAAVLTAAGLWLVLWEPGGAAHGASRSSTTSLRIAPGPGATEIGLKGSF